MGRKNRIDSPTIRGISARKPSPAALRRELAAHARSIIDTFGDTVGVLAPWGLSESRSTYVPASLRQHPPDEPVRVDASPSDRETAVGDGERSRVASLVGVASPVVPEDELLARDLDGGPFRSLVVIAPPGAGKSALLESLALSLARKLLAELDSRAALLPSAQVPLLISLTQAATAPTLMTYINGEGRKRLSSLSRPAIRLLAAQRRLLLLVDGFDEVPSASRRIAQELRSLQIPFVLTSRPGYGAHEVVDDPQRHMTIAELRPSQLRSYVKSYFTARGGDRPDNLKARLEELERTPDRLLHDWLTRPLYIKTWCEYVASDPQRRAPGSLGVLSRCLLSKFALRNDLARTLRDADGESSRSDHDAVDEFALWIGKLGYYFAQRGFGAQLCADVEGKELVERAKRNGLLRASLQSGLLIMINGLYYLAKIPLVEYCIGQYLAHDVASHPTAPRLLIGTFRRWIWQRPLYDILDYSFDALWNAGGKTEKQWASDLLNWAVNADGIHSPGSPISKCGQPDGGELSHPFSVAALRWHALNASPASDHRTEIRRAAATLAQSWLSQEATHGDQRRMLPTGSLPYAMVIAFLESFADTHLSDAERWWKICAPAVESVARSVRPADAVRMVEEAIDRYARCVGDGNHANRNGAKGNGMNVWSRTSESAAYRVNSDDAASVCRRWMEQARRSAALEVRSAWLTAAERCARLADRPDASSIVEQAIAGAEDESLEFGWIAVAIAAATRLSNDDVARAIEMLTFKLQGAEAGDAQAMWGCAIQAAAGCLRSDEALACVEHWFAAYRKAKAPKHRKAHLAAAFGAALRINPADVVSVVNTCLELLTSTDDGPEQWQLSQVLAELCASLPETDSAKVLDVLLRQNSSDCEWAIASAAYRLLPERSAHIIRRCVRYHHDALRRRDSVGAFQFAIAAKGAASRVRHDDAAGITELLIEQYRVSDGHAYVWLAAVENAAGRLGEADAARLTKRCMDAHASAVETSETCNASTRSSIALLEVLAKNLNQLDAVATCTFLLQKGEKRGAVSVASAANVIIVTQGVRGQVPVLRALERTPPAAGELTLDPSLSVAPLNIRKGLLGSLSLTFVQEKLLSALEEQFVRSQAARDEKEAWLSWSTWAQKAALTRQHIDQDEQAAIVGALLGYGLIESARPGKTIVKYRITADGVARVKSKTAAAQIP